MDNRNRKDALEDRLITDSTMSVAQKSKKRIGLPLRAQKHSSRGLFFIMQFLSLVTLLLSVIALPQESPSDYPCRDPVFCSKEES
jgi:hypothetical protein